MQVGGSQEEDKETKKREAYINRHMNAPDRPPIIDERRLKTRQLQQQMANASHIDASADGPAQAPAASGGLPKSSLAGFSGPVVKPGVGYDGGSLQNLASERAKKGHIGLTSRKLRVMDGGELAVEEQTGDSNVPTQLVSFQKRVLDRPLLKLRECCKQGRAKGPTPSMDGMRPGAVANDLRI
eukprot:CAMPEP_0119377546 /NCGR_PEP_ID=MMETSP1334-20130426/45418_1 /TAXON_ID=127549 /ORGANISM="Calcidiscus leptoporus, Strain RCC1130" /LENGTH=182 /DNA_ID=CAMNT_0007396503 /DNA_START=220 /DNA_END=769 /DNA_ORIENTATION=-